MGKRIVCVWSCDWCRTDTSVEYDEKDYASPPSWVYEDGEYLCPDCSKARLSAIQDVQEKRRAKSAPGGG